MAIRVKIVQNFVPAPFTTLKFVVASQVGDLYYQVTTGKKFVTGVPASSSQVQIGEFPGPSTIENLHANLVAHADANSIYTREGSTIYINFVNIANYNLFLTEDADGAYSVTAEVVDDPDVPEPTAPAIYDLQILIIDTYDNDRPLIDERTQITSPTLSYDGGDDIFEPFLSSKLVFNIYVDDAADAKFYHLFTGDENRYLVQLNNLPEDIEAEPFLLWQGYLLPDQGSEPYKNVAFFVTFTAVDMISSLKGKYFDPWVYAQKYTMPELFGMLLGRTGLQQEMWVKPSIVNATASGTWRQMICDLKPYAKDGKYSDLYSILKDLLTSQCMQLFSLKGKWHIEGFTRKGEVTGRAFVFNAEGGFQRMYWQEKYPSEIMQSQDSVTLTSITPFKAVNVNFAYDESNNLFTDDVVYREAMYAEYEDDAFVISSPVTTYFEIWNKVGAPFLTLSDGLRRFSFTRTTPHSTSDVWDVTEAQALINYYECPQKPFVVPGKVYELELEIDVVCWWTFGYSATAIAGPLQDGAFDTLPLWQLLLNGTEIRSNRPSSVYKSLNLWDYKEVTKSITFPEYGPFNAIHTLTFKLKREFTVATEGYLSYRQLSPTYDQFFDSGNALWKDWDVKPTVLKVNVIDGDVDENVRAIRDIAFTEVVTIDLPITSSVNDAIPNNYSLGNRIGFEEQTIAVGAQTDATFTQTFPPVNVLDLDFKAFVISLSIEKLIFIDNNADSLYVQKPDGSKFAFKSLYTKRIINGIFGPSYFMLYYLIAFDGRPKIPKSYKALPVLEATDVLKCLLSNFSNEELENRALWHVYGYPEWQYSYPKTVANAYHVVRSEPLLNLSTQVMDIMFPDELPRFWFNGKMRTFLPTSLTINLVGSKTDLNAKEAVGYQLNDITYE